ncbi:hypothetical protein EKO04_006114 [Ascochyta lentis]|uniref:Uncharacterized protein n=1 Tax=Ascochyta lentis TaxID=205686 RepID=A0A8H7J1G9_9PLEO|nr:hypothetical protein EKO04_006114 [Ascochyta lentis]
MPGLCDSKWASKPANNAHALTPTNNTNHAGTDRHVTVPSFGYTLPGASTSRFTSNSSRSNARPPSRADVAGKAAAQRMDELLTDHHDHHPSPTPNDVYGKPLFYQEHAGRGLHQQYLLTKPSTPPARDAYSTAEANKVQRTRLYDLFRQWVPRAEEFYSIQESVELSSDEVAAIKKEIIDYRVQRAIAASKRTTYTAPWETSPSYMGHSKYAPNRTTSGAQKVEDSEEASATELDPFDPFGLGLVSSPVPEDKGCSSDVVDLMG